MSLLDQSSETRIDHFANGHLEARSWAAGKRDWRVKSRLKDYEEWVGSANGDHRPESELHAHGYMYGLREHLGR